MVKVSKTVTLREYVWLYYFDAVNTRLKKTTTGEYRRLLEKTIFPEFGDRLLTSLSKIGIRRWHGNLTRTTPVQANRALAVLSAVLTEAVQDEFLEFNPAAGLKYNRERPRERYYSPKEIRQLFDVIKQLTPEEGSFLLVALYTGARPGELKAARWEYLKGDVIELPDSKTGRRDIYLPHAALVALSPVHGPEEGPIYPTVRFGPLWKRVRRLSGLKNARLYDLRHTFSSAALAADLPLEALSQLLGHRDPRTTRRYAHLMRDTGRAAVGRIAEQLPIPDALVANW